MAGSVLECQCEPSTIRACSHAKTAAETAERRLLLWALGGYSRRLLLVSAVMNAASALAGVVFWLF
jgi:hypothetical protein